MAKTKIILNDLEAIQILLQENYERANKQCKQAQDELGILKTSLKIKDLTPDEVSKICKAKKDYMDIINKSITMINDIAKLMSDIVRYQGNVKEALEDEAQKQGKVPKNNGSLDIRSLQKQLRDMTGENKETYNIK